MAAGIGIAASFIAASLLGDFLIPEIARRLTGKAGEKGVRLKDVEKVKWLRKIGKWLDEHHLSLPEAVEQINSVLTVNKDELSELGKATLGAVSELKKRIDNQEQLTAEDKAFLAEMKKNFDPDKFEKRLEEILKENAGVNLQEIRDELTKFFKNMDWGDKLDVINSKLDLVLKELIEIKESQRIKIPEEVPPEEIPPNVSEFVDRETYLEDLRNLLGKNMIVIQGIAGIGKTQIAAKLKDNIENECVTFWKELHDFDTFDSVTRALARFLRKKGAPELARHIEGGAADHETIRKMLLSSLENKNYVLFFDNYHEVENKEIQYIFGQFKDRLKGSTIVITTRNPPPFVIQDPDDNKVTEKVIKGFDLEGTREYLEQKRVKVSEEQLVKIDQKIGGHPLSLRMFTSLSVEREIDEIIENLPKTRRLERYLYNEIYKKLSKDEKKVLKTLSVFRTAVTADACVQVSKTANVRVILLGLSEEKLLVEREKDLYYLHDLIREFSYNLIDKPKEYHKRAGEYYSSLSEKTPENITETCYHLIKYYGAVNDGIIKYLMGTPGDVYTDLIILDVLVNNAIQSSAIFDLIEKILANENSEVRFIAVDTMVKNRDLDVDRALELLEKRIEDKNETESVREESISSLSTLMKFRFEKIVSIFEEIINSGDKESLEYVCYALKDAGIKDEKTVKIIRQIIAYNGVTTPCKRLASDILDDWKVLDTSSEIDYLYKLREKDSSQAIVYLEDLMFGSNQFNRFNINYYFFAWVLGELYRVKKSESANLMKKLIENVSGTIGAPWIISRVLLSKEGLQYDTIRDFIVSENFLVRMSGSMTILQTYTCLDFFQRKYNIQDKNFEKISASVKEDSIKLLELLRRDEDDFLRKIATILLQEIVDPSEPQKSKVRQRVLDEMIKGFLKIVSLDMLVKFVKASNTGHDLRTYYMMGVLILLSWTQVNPEKVYPILKVQNACSDMATHIVLLYYHKIRNSPEDLLEILNKFGFKSSEYLTRIGSVGISHGLMLPIPEKMLDTYKSLLLDHEYQDRGSKIALLYSLSLMRKWFAFIEDYKTEHNHEINNIVRGADKLIQKLAQDKDKEVSMLADLVLRGIHIRS